MKGNCGETRRDSNVVFEFKIPAQVLNSQLLGAIIGAKSVSRDKLQGADSGSYTRQGAEMESDYLHVNICKC